MLTKLTFDGEERIKDDSKQRMNELCYHVLKEKQKEKT